MKKLNFKKEWVPKFGPAREIHFELNDSAEVKMKYIIPGLAFTRRPKVCFAIVLYVWNKRALLRFILDKKKATPTFKFK